MNDPKTWYIVAMVLFIISGSTRWWSEPQRLYWSAPVALGLFFLTLALFLGKG